MSGLDVIEVMPICELVRNSQLICIFRNTLETLKNLDKLWKLESRTIPQTIPFIGVGAFFRVCSLFSLHFSAAFRFIGMVLIPFSAYIENSWHFATPFLLPPTYAFNDSIIQYQERKIRQKLQVIPFIPATIIFDLGNRKRLQHIAPAFLFFSWVGNF